MLLEKKSPSLVAEIININTSVSIGFNISNLYLIELMLIGPIMIFCG